MPYCKGFYYLPLVLLSMLGMLSHKVVATEPKHVGFYFDQDMFLPLVNEDRDYTMGVAMEFVVQENANDPTLSLLDSQLKRLGEALGAHDPDEKIHRSYLIGSVNFTPEDLSSEAAQFDDRPYASVVFLANKRMYADDDRAVGIEAQVGILGTYTPRAGTTRSAPGGSPRCACALPTLNDCVTCQSRNASTWPGPGISISDTRPMHPWACPRAPGY